jgi:lipopolysaccharide/colanic/teichoic acid biosynthesis glycosyltransferase
MAELSNMISPTQSGQTWLASGESRSLHRLRFQLLGCLIFAVAIPYAIGFAWLPQFSAAVQTNQTLVGSLAAIVAGVWLYRSLSTFPGIRASSYIIPSFGLSYIAVVVIFFLGRFEYNRLLMIAGFLASVSWFYASSVIMFRQRKMRIGVVGIGGARQLENIADIEWVKLGRNDVDMPHVDAVVADLRADLPDEWDRKIADFALKGIPVYHVKQLQESLTGRVELEHLSENNFGSLIPAYAYFQVKHLVDWLMAAVAIVVLSPMLVVTAALISFDSDGSPVFRQRRVGYGGTVFTVYKFRTMLNSRSVGVADVSAAQTQHNDERITRLGRILRKTRIDELPQIWNILLGEMSWIGPRPEAEVLSNWYENEIPFYRYRHIVRPGITGWAQVNQGHVVDVDDVRSKLHYDFYYIKNFSPWIDLLIVAKTIQTVLTGFGHR